MDMQKVREALEANPFEPVLAVTLAHNGVPREDFFIRADTGIDLDAMSNIHNIRPLL